MTTTTVTAKDTSSAMEDIINQLGDDAVILSTNQKHGKVEMTATTDITSTTPRRLKPSQQFSRIFESRMLEDQILGDKDKPLELTQALNENSGLSMSQLSAVRSEINEIKNMLAGVVVTEPENLNEKFSSSISFRLRQFGFSPKIVKILEESFSGKDFENARVSFLRSLAKRLVPNTQHDLKSAKVIYVIGGSGNGKTTLVAKLAAFLAEKIETNKNKICLTELNYHNSSISDSLRSYARLLNLSSALINHKDAPPMFEGSSQMIVDVSTSIEEASESINSARKLYGKNKVSVVLCLPGGSSKSFIKMLWSLCENLKPIIALNKLDECEMGAIEFSELAELNANISIITGTNNLVGTIAMATENVMTQYLKENC